MPMMHSAYLFDYDSFRRHIAPIIQEVDQGNYLSLYRQAEVIVNSVIPNEWLLQDRGTVLESISPADDIDSASIGYLLLVILSSFLQQAPSISYWSILQNALSISGWSEKDTWLLIRGEFTTSLLKPNIMVSQRPIIRISDPYWYWMLPTQANQAGWLYLDQVYILHAKLAADKSTISNLYGKDVDGLWKDLHNAYTEAISMLQAAKEAKQGLFMIIS